MTTTAVKHLQQILSFNQDEDKNPILSYHWREQMSQLSEKISDPNKSKSKGTPRKVQERLKKDGNQKDPSCFKCLQPLKDISDTKTRVKLLRRRRESHNKKLEIRCNQCNNLVTEMILPKRLRQVKPKPTLEILESSVKKSKKKKRNKDKNCGLVVSSRSPSVTKPYLEKPSKSKLREMLQNVANEKKTSNFTKFLVKD